MPNRSLRLAESSNQALQSAGLCRMTDEGSIISKFGKDVRKLAENPFQRQLEEARREWKQRKGFGKWQSENSLPGYITSFHLASQPDSVPDPLNRDSI
jgi:hypothetical protein